MLLFLDATEIPAKAFRQHRGLIVRLLVHRASAVAGRGLAGRIAVLPGRELLGAGGDGDGRSFRSISLRPGRCCAISAFPAPIRETLNVESGLNDGLIAPVFLICLAGATSGAAGDEPVAVLVDALPALIIAVLVGLVIGCSVPG